MMMNMGGGPATSEFAGIRVADWALALVYLTLAIVVVLVVVSVVRVVVQSLSEFRHLQPRDEPSAKLRRKPLDGNSPDSSSLLPRRAMSEDFAASMSRLRQTRVVELSARTGVHLLGFSKSIALKAAPALQNMLRRKQLDGSSTDSSSLLPRRAMWEDFSASISRLRQTRVVRLSARTGIHLLGFSKSIWLNAAPALQNIRTKYTESPPGLSYNGQALSAAVFNENEVRAAAGLTMALGTVAFVYAYFAKIYVPIQIVTTLFFFEFLIRLTVGLTYSPMGMLARLMTQRQAPQWVSAKPKRFAWTLGLVMSLAMVVITNSGIRGPLPLTICLICLTLMWLEAVLGLCLGCEIHGLMVRRGWATKDAAFEVCAHDACAIKTQQKTG